MLEEEEIPPAGYGREALFGEEVFPRSDTSDFVGSVHCVAPGERRSTGMAVELDAGNRMFTALLLVPVMLQLCAALAAPSEVHAQTLVSNTGKTTSAALALAPESQSNYNYFAQEFTTGASDRGYRLDSIDLLTSNWTRSFDESDLSVYLAAGGSLAASLADLTAPGSISHGYTTFIAPAGTTLAGNTSYAVVVIWRDDDSPEVATTASDDEDGESLPGWSIGDGLHWNTTVGIRNGEAFTAREDALKIRVNGSVIGAVIESVEFTSDPGAVGTYALGGEVRMRVRFSEAVEVVGSPELVVRVGSERKPAVYASGTGTLELAFSYTVAEGDEDSDGLSSEAGSLALNGGAIEDGSENAPALEHAGLPDQAGHKVDGGSPVLVASGEAEVEGDRLILTYDEALDASWTPEADDFRVTVEERRREVSQVTVREREVRLRLAAAVEAGEAVTLSYAGGTGAEVKPIRDQAGNVAGSFTDRAVTNRTGEGTAQSVGALSERAVRQIQELLAEKKRRTTAQKKISSQLLDAARPSDDVTERQPPTDIAEGGMVTVDIRADVTPAVLARIRALGGTVVNSVPKYRAIRARLPLTALEPVAALEAVQFIRPADQAITNQAPGRAIRRATVPASKDHTAEGGVAHQADVARQDHGADGTGTGIGVLSNRMDNLADRKAILAALKENTTEGDVAHQADVARRDYSVDGTGIGIGVLSDGIDSLAGRQATGDLPAQVTVLAGQRGEGAEGTAMLEIVHDLAPGAQLYFATALGGQAQFAANIEALCEAGADVIADDVLYSKEAALQDDVVAKGVNAAVADGCVYFSAAGNFGNLNNGTSGVWEGDYTAGSLLIVDGRNVGVSHDFGDGVEGNQTTGVGAYILQWSDPLGASMNDYDLFLLDEDGEVVASSTDTQGGNQDPIEFISPVGIARIGNTGDRLVIVKVRGADRYLRLDTLGGKLKIATAGTMFGHSAAANAVSVAAVDVRDADGGAFDGTESVDTISSDGPRRIFFEPDGTPITPNDFSSSGGKLLQKPDLSAATCVSTATPRFSPFCGTSAAGPHAAAVAALVLDAAGGLANLEQPALRAALTGAALDIEAAGVDRDSGAGIVMAPGAVDAVAAAVTAPMVSMIGITSDPGADQTYAAEDGIEVTVTFNRPVTVTGHPQLTLKVGDADRRASYQSSAGAALLFSYEVVDGESDSDGVSIDSDSLALNGGTIAGSSGNALLGHEAEESSHRVDGIKPVFQSATVSGRQIVLAYDEALDGTSVPTVGQFGVTVAGMQREVTRVDMDGSVAILTLAEVVKLGELVTVTYREPSTSPIRDAAGNIAIAFMDEPAPVTFSMDELDLTEDGAFDSDDALVMAYSYTLESALGNGETGGTETGRSTLLGDLWGGSRSGEDDDFRGMLRKANAWKDAEASASGDVTEDGGFDGNDAKVMYYTYKLGALLGDGATGGLARYRRSVLGGLWGGLESNVSDDDLRSMLRNAHWLRNAVR